MENDVFVWDEEVFVDDQCVSRLGWSIFNEGCLELLAKDGEYYQFPPSSIYAIFFIKPTLFNPGGVCVRIADDYKKFAKEKYGTDLITLDQYAGWKKLSDNELLDINLLANILAANDIPIKGDYDAFFKRIQKIK